jgi:CRISPR-associated protein Cst2
MSWHLHGAIITGLGTAANNRGQGEGNITTLQKLLWQDRVHTTVSAEAIRWAVRYWWQSHSAQRPELETNRRWDDEKEDNAWQDQSWSGWQPGGEGGKTYIDDDVLGFMLAEGAKIDASDSSDEPEGDAEEGKGKGKGKGKKTKAKGTINKRRGVLEVTRAISLIPYAGDVTFNARSGTKGNTSLYGTELHATRYQYGFSMTPARLREPARLLPTLEALLSLGEVAGNHSRFLYDFSPDAVVLRWTHDPAPRLLYCFGEQGAQICAPDLVRRVAAGDVDARELIVGGALSGTPHGDALAAAGAQVFPGVKAARDAMLARIREAQG